MRLHSSALFFAGLSCAACFIFGCKPLPPSKPASEFTPEEARGAQVFQQNCSRCHYPTTTRNLKGPGLQAITKQSALPSGAAPTDAEISDAILHGRGEMKAIALNHDDLTVLLAYLHTL